ncbi:hypothetical protein [Agrobacterium pusense]|uniref:hypothetical protein n=1 Tax=Agrobacterium pusense TaxID=648995 RepID=UPI000D1C0727|nr:hypothetical protein [Agrobacterium pusense]
MANMVKIGSAMVDVEDPCALYAALYAVRAQRIAGGQIEESEIRSPVMQQRIKVASSSLADIDSELSRLRAACELKTTGRRTRFAKRIRFST